MLGFVTTRSKILMQDMFLFSFFLFWGLFLVSHWIVSPFFLFLVLFSKHCNFYALDIKSDVFSCFFLQKFADQMWSLDFISFFLSYGNNIMWHLISCVAGLVIGRDCDQLDFQFTSFKCLLILFLMLLSIWVLGFFLDWISSLTCGLLYFFGFIHF